MPADTSAGHDQRTGATHQAMSLAVSVVIPVRNEVQSLPALVESLRAQTFAPGEIIIVDGGSDDGTGALVRTLAAADEKIRLIATTEATPGRGRNVGIAAARHDWIALTDAGIRLEPTWLEHLVAAVVRQSDVDVVYGNYEPVIDGLFTRCAALAYVPPKQRRAEGLSRGPSTASMLITRDVWQRVGGFPDLRATEDLIFMERIEQCGAKIAWAPQATVWWQLRPSLASTFQKFVLYSEHNVRAGRQRYWHYGLLRQYIVAAVFVLLAVLHSRWWLLALMLGVLARTAKSIWQRRAGRGLMWALNPIQFGYVLLILLIIDLATFIGWARAATTEAPARTHTDATNS
jgi:glycosyltransferase involved in cell wall biosynthesis